MSSVPYDYIVKILAIGDSGVGKTALITRFSENVFQETYISTLGVDFKIRTVQSEGMTIRVQLWDTAGQEKFRAITSAYYRGAQGILLVFDITDFKSFNNIKTWMNEIKTHANNSVVTLLVGNKADMGSQRSVTQSQAETFARDLKVEYLEGSAKTGLGIEAIFSRLIKLVTDQSKHAGATPLPRPQTAESTSLLSSSRASTDTEGCSC